MSATNEILVTPHVKRYWETASCGTNRTRETKHSQSYFEEIEDFRYRYEPFIHSFAQFTRWHNKDILEVGVGAGTDFLQFVRAGARATGVDLTEESIRNVRERLDVYGLAAQDLRVCNAEELPYDTATFDLVYSWGVVHHAGQSEKVLAEIHRVTRPRGTVKIMVYNVNSAHAWHMYLRHALLRGRPFRGRRWAIYNFQESYATKAYSQRDIRRLVGEYAHSGLRFYFWEQIVRRGGKLETPRRLLQRLTPPRARWYMAFEYQKEAT